MPIENMGNGFTLARRYDPSADAEQCILSKDGVQCTFHILRGESATATIHHYCDVIQKQLDARLAIGTQLLITGFVRAKLSPHYEVLPHRQGEFYLRDNQRNIDYALPPGTEALHITQLTGTVIKQGEFDGEYRGATAALRGPATQARANPNAPGALGPVPTPAPRIRPVAAREGTRVVERLAPRWGEIVAYRAWFWDEALQSLTSVSYHPLSWLPGEPMRDSTLVERNPYVLAEFSHIEENNRAGVWSFKDTLGAVNEYLVTNGSGHYAASTALGAGNLSLVLGSCYIWGTVIEHEKGYRSQFGAIRSVDAIYGCRGTHSAHDPLHLLDVPGVWEIRAPAASAESLRRIRELYKLEGFSSGE